MLFDKRVLIVGGAVLAGGLSGCGGGGGSSGGAGGNTGTAPLVQESIEVDIPAVAVDPVALVVQVVDTDGNPVTTSGTVTVLEDSAGVFGQSQYQVVSGVLNVGAVTLPADEDNNGIPDVPIKVTLKFEGFDQYLGVSKKFEITGFGSNTLEVALVSLAGSETLSVKQETATLASKTVTVLPGQDAAAASPAVVVAFVTEAESSNKPSSAVYLSPELGAYDDEGTELDTASVTVTTVATPAGEVNKTGVIQQTGVVSVTNLADLEVDGLLSQPVGEKSKIQLQSLGNTQVVITDAAGKKVSSVNPASPITVEIELPAGSVDPNTGNDILPGDLVPVWTRSDDGASWQYMGRYAVHENAEGRLKVYVATTHLSHFNVAYANVVDACSGRIYVKNPAGENFAINGMLRLSNARFDMDDAYRGSSDGQLVYTDIPDEPTDILFISGDGESVAVVPEVTTLAVTENGEIRESGLRGVDLCGSDGATLTLNREITEPTIVVEASRGYRLDGGFQLYSIWEGNPPAAGNEWVVPIKLINAPEEPVELSYVFNGSGDAVATEGEDFTLSGASGGTLTLSKDQPSVELRITTLPDDEEETRYKRFGMTLTTGEQALFMSGGTTYTLSSSIYDEDRPVLESVSVTDVIEGESIEVTVTLDRPAQVSGTAHLYLGMDDRDGVVTALPGYDYHPNDMLLAGDVTRAPDMNFSLYGGYGSHAFSRFAGEFRVSFGAGDKVAVAHVPTLDNPWLDPDRTVKVAVGSLYGLYYPDDRTAAVAYARIEDNDVPSGLAPTAYALDVQDQYGEAFSADALNEGSDLLYLLSLDQPAQADLAFPLSLSGESAARFLVAEDGVLRPISGDSELVIPAGEQTAKIYLNTEEDGYVLPDYSTGELVISPPAGFAGGNIPLDLTVLNTTTTTVSVSLVANNYGYEFVEGDSDGFPVRVSYRSNNSDVLVAMSDMVVGLDDLHPAVDGEDFSMPDRAMGTFSDYYDSRHFMVNVIDDEESEYSKRLHFQTTVLSGIPEGYGDYGSPENGDTLSETVVITDNDGVVISTRDRAFEFESNGDFAGEVKAGVKISIPLSVPLSFLVTLVGTDLPFDVQEQTVTVPAGETMGEAVFSLSGLTPASLGLDTDNRKQDSTVKATVRLTEASRQVLVEELGLPFIISKGDADLTLSFEYTGQAQSGGNNPGTGATGGTSSSGTGLF